MPLRASANVSEGALITRGAAAGRYRWLLFKLAHWNEAENEVYCSNALRTESESRDSLEHQYSNAGRLLLAKECRHEENKNIVPHSPAVIAANIHTLLLL